MWSTRYLVHNLTLDQAADELTRLLGVDFHERQSSYVGRYYAWWDSDTKVDIDIKLNWIDEEGGELVHPDLPEGLFLAISTPEENPYHDILDGNPNYELYGTKEFGRSPKADTED